MSTSDELNLAKDRSTSGFVSADRQQKIDYTKFRPGQVDIVRKAAKIRNRCQRHFRELANPDVN